MNQSELRSQEPDVVRKSRFLIASQLDFRSEDRVKMIALIN